MFPAHQMCGQVYQGLGSLVPASCFFREALCDNSRSLMSFFCSALDSAAAAQCQPAFAATPCLCCEFPHLSSYILRGRGCSMCMEACGATMASGQYQGQCGDERGAQVGGSLLTKGITWAGWHVWVRGSQCWQQKGGCWCASIYPVY